MLPALRRNFATAVRYHAQGAPAQVLKYVSSFSCSSLVVEDVGLLPKTLGQHEVAVKFLAAPVNPADLSMVTGGYGIKAALPAIGGNEGVAQVTAIGQAVSSLKVGDRVIPAVAGFGTWRTEAVAKEDELLAVPSSIPVEYAATLAVNPCTAYRLLADFAKLGKDDVVIQNGANSAVGQAVIQLAALRGIKTINIIREDQHYADTVENLKGLGATIVCPDHYLGTADFKRLIADLPAPKVAFNCVGGDNGLQITKVLGKNGVAVTYGGMAREPVMTSTTALVFNNISLRGFWMTEWAKHAPVEERKAMLKELADLMAAGKLRSWVETYPFSDFENALDKVVNRLTKRKVVLLME
ncbi:trans-2-enoyl-CoA reductase [Thraustotheca clavata]|uniref:enoyl-[acyl-carrier-protein] reductase n=1 Tax=Thraustotheca clavata TaxID=74557 RepID=A0A1W0A0V0_9STRA|nr:trans-2-enoyl-CoA reductase [Thraustotheca clavata]